MIAAVHHFNLTLHVIVAGEHVDTLFSQLC